MRFIRQRDGVFERFSVSLPFTNEHASYPSGTPFEILKRDGYLKLTRDSPPKIHPYTQRLGRVSVVRLNDDEAGLEFEVIDMSIREQIERFGASSEALEIDDELIENSKNQQNASLLGNTTALLELQEERLELLKRRVNIIERDKIEYAELFKEN